MEQDLSLHLKVEIGIKASEKDKDTALNLLIVFNEIQDLFCSTVNMTRLLYP